MVKMVFTKLDTMHPRWVNRIDILESPNTKPYKFTNAEIVKTELKTKVEKPITSLN